MSEVRKQGIEILHGPPVGRIRETTPPRQRRSEKSCGPLIGGWVERDLNSEDIPLTRRCNFVGETEEVESVMYPAVLSKLQIIGTSDSADASGAITISVVAAEDHNHGHAFRRTLLINLAAKLVLLAHAARRA